MMSLICGLYRTRQMNKQNKAKQKQTYRCRELSGGCQRGGRSGDGEIEEGD